MIREISLAAAIVLLSGCSLTGNKERFTCPENKDGVCASARDVYRATDAPRVVGLRADGERIAGRIDSAATRPVTGSARGGTTIPAQTGTILAISPVVIPARAMRIWFAPFEDASGNLHAGGFVWTEMSGRRWAYGTDVASTGSRNVYPLMVEPRVDRPVGAAITSPSQSAPRLPSDRAVGSD